MEHDTASVTLVFLVSNYFKEHNLPYEIVPNASDSYPFTAVRLRGGITGRKHDDWLGWIYETEFKTFNWSMNRIDGLMKHISAHDPEFFPKLNAWLPECITLLKNEAVNRIV
jgi:hypothetical protein